MLGVSVIALSRRKSPIPVEVRFPLGLPLPLVCF